MSEEYVACNLCEQNNSKPFYVINSSRIVKCQTCGLIYMNPRPSQSEIITMYSKSYFLSPDPLSLGYEDYSAERKSLTKMFLRHLKDVERYTKDGKILDVGCAMGFFLDLARSRGWQVYGVDISEYAASYAREQLGLDVVTGTLKEAREGRKRGWDNLFDVVTMWDLLEHLSDPFGDLAEAWHVLKDNGLIFLTVPNVESLIARLMRSKWYGFKKLREHLYFFSPTTIQRMLKRAGFEVLETRRATLTFSFKFLVDKLAQYSNSLHRLSRWVITRGNLADKSVNFKYIDIMVIARKLRS